MLQSRDIDISTQERAASTAQTKSMLGGFAAQEDLDLQEAEEETGDKRLVQLAEKTANQKSERGRVSASLVAALLPKPVPMM